MDPKQISSLAKLLRDSGDKVLNDNFKLSLSGQMLRALNDSFSLIAETSEIFAPQSFQVVKPHNSKSDVFRDLQFIHDFVQKTKILQIVQFHNDDRFDGEVDISKFRNLQQLEIQRVMVNQIIGIQQMRAHLRSLSCVRCIDSVKEIISHCGGDKSNGFIWNELKVADFSSNSLVDIDCSLEFAPWLQHLNLSHNQITSADALKWLPHLKYLNLGFNRLTIIPKFHAEASRRLKVLILTNNFIEDLCGISRLDALNELDLSWNCLLDHSTLLPLSTVVTLQYLNLLGNPLACHPKHRQATCRYLHKNTSTTKFILDAELLSRTENSLTGSFRSYHTVLTSRLSNSNRSTSQTSITSRISRFSTDTTPASSVGSTTNQFFGNPTNKDSSDEQQPQSTNAELMTSSIISVQKKLKPRPAIIADLDYDEDDNVEKNQIINNTNSQQQTSLAHNSHGNNDNESSSSSKILECTKHLETKKQIEDLRKRYGDDWLQNHGEQLSGDNVGENKIAKLKSKKMIEDLLEDLNRQHLPPSGVIVGSATTPISNNNNNNKKTINDEPIMANKMKINESTDSNYETGDDGEFNESNKTIYNTALDEIYIPESPTAIDIYAPTTLLENIDTPSDPEDDEITYMVHSELISDEELFLIISSKSIREKDVLNGRTKTKWDLQSLESCERIKMNTIKLIFDTIKKSNQSRQYRIEENQCQQLEQYLRSILASRPINQVIFQCVKCQTQFAREQTATKKQTFGGSNIHCPACQSVYLIEIKDKTKILNNNQSSSPQSSSKIQTKSMNTSTPILPAIQKIVKDTAGVGQKTGVSSTTDSNKTKNPIENCESHSSIGSVNSLNESSSCSKISKSGSSFDSNQSVAGSSNSDREADFIQQNNESDVEILSNPSQSSIEVLDYTTRPNSRKPSFDLRGGHLSPLQDSTDNESSNNNNNNNNDGNITTIDTAAHDLIAVAASLTDDDKKSTILFSNANLTESSSSGSVTDSICTTYEQTAGSSTSTGGGGGSGDGASSNIEQSPIANNKKSLTPTTPEKLPNKIMDTSVISSMLGGLFQSTNLLMSRNGNQRTDSGTKCEKYKFSYINFDNVDHRLKLFIYQTIFEDEKNNEQLKWLVRGKLFIDGVQNQNGPGSFIDGIVLMSTTKFYVLFITGPENDDPSKWIKRQFSKTVDRVEMVRVLPWKIGVSFSIKGIDDIHLILQDISRTDSLLAYFASNPLPDYCQLEYQISERLSQKLLKITGNVQIKMLAILNECEISMNESTQQNQLTGLVITDTNLYLISSPFQWICSETNDIECRQEQLMSNLVEYEKLTNKTLRFNFLDENQEDKCELWCCSFETESNASCTLSSISQSWEKLFGVPLSNNDDESEY